MPSLDLGVVCDKSPRLTSRYCTQSAIMGKVLIGLWPGERIVDKVSRFVDIEESGINDS